MVETKAMKKERKKAEAAQRTGLSWFAAKMLAKLVLRNKRIGTDEQQQGTLLGQKKKCDIYWYYRRMLGETKELLTALKRHKIQCNEKTRDAVISEAADVANFAAAIAEKAVEDTR